MVITRSHQGTVSILSLQGPMIEEELGVLEREVEASLGSGITRLVLEMRQAPFIDSAGLEKIQALAADLGRRGGDIRVCSLNEVCRDIFLCTRMESLVQVYPDRDTAVRSLV